MALNRMFIQLLRGCIVKSNLIALTTVTLLAVGGSMLAPVTVGAATNKSPDAVYFSTENVSAKSDVDTKDLDAKLADARARLEQAAHDVAELSSDMGRPLMDKLMIFNGEGPPPAVIGVQLDAESGKDGARIQEVSPGGPADEAGVRVGDVITAINGTEVKGEGTARQVLHLMHKVTPESKVHLRVAREGKPRDFVVTARRGMTFLGMQEPAIPPLPPMPPDFSGGGRTFGPVFIRGPLGEMELATLTPQLGRYFGTDKGVLVVRAPKDFKLEDGDVILAIDGREPTSGSHATRILGSYQPGEKIAIKVMRQQKTVNVETTLPERGPSMGPGPDRKVRMIIRKGGNAMT
jgi:membrane-associated protease RseP (regulator of RpoE activity)